MKKHIASCSFGKDSLAMILKLIEKQYPLDEVVFYDTGKEFQAIYNLRDKVKPLLKSKGIEFTELSPPESFDYMMFEHRTKSGKTGYGWCGNVCRWGTFYKQDTIKKHCKEHYQYVGIAVDETDRFKTEEDLDNGIILFKDKNNNPNKKYPLAEWGMTEKDCLDYCYSQGYDWSENGVELYSILDRVSCWCCRNKNLKELKGIYRYLPEYWQKLREIQVKLPEPMKGYYDKKKTRPKGIFELEERFKAEIKKEQEEKRKHARTAQ